MDLSIKVIVLVLRPRGTLSNFLSIFWIKNTTFTYFERPLPLYRLRKRKFLHSEDDSRSYWNKKNPDSNIKDNWALQPALKHIVIKIVFVHTTLEDTIAL